MAPATRRTFGSLLAASAVLACSAACSGTSGGGDAQPGGPSGEVLVAAAASLGGAFGEFERLLEVEHPDLDVVLVLAGSSTLRQQALAGAPFDVLATADEATMAEVVEAGLVAEVPDVFATNVLRLAVPAGNAAGVTGIEDVADPDLLVGLCAPDVPCGRLGRRALEAVDVEASPDTEELDVAALTARLVAGELDVALVYATDVAAAGGRLESIELPAAATLATSYPLALLAGAPNPEAAAAFAALVTSERGRAVLRDAGFGAP